MLNPYHLKYFCDACRTRSITEAAKRNRISHSAVSQAIRSIEEALGVQLLVHAKRHFELTAEGQALFERADRALDELASLPSMLGTDSGLRGQLKLGFSHSVWNGVLSNPISAFLENCPEIRLSISIGNSNSLAGLLLAREVELGFGIEDGSFSSMERVTIRRGRFVLAGRRERVKRNRFLVGDKGSEVRELVSALQKQKERPELMFIQSWSMIADLAAQGHGIGLVPDFCLTSRPGLIRVLPKIKLPEYEFHAFYRSERHLSLAARELLRSLKQGGTGMV